MSGINLSRVVIAGLVAGVVANALDFAINSYLMADEMADMAQRLNLNMALVDGSATAWIVADFVWGFLLVFAYAAMRPRFGPGPKTAIIAGLTLYLGVTAMFGGLAAMGVFTQQAYIKASALSLVSTFVPALVGGYLYKE
jgi:hypothetical protein